MSAAAFARGVGNLSSDLTDRFGYVGPEIKVQPFNAVDYSPGAEIAKLGTSLIAHARSKANQQRLVQHMRLQDELLQARADYMRERMAYMAQGGARRQPVGYIDQPGPQDPNLTGPPDPNNVRHLPVYSTGQLIALQNELDPNSQQNQFKRLQMANIQDMMRNRAETQTRISAGADTRNVNEAAKAWANDFVQRHMYAWDIDPNKGGKLRQVTAELSQMNKSDDGYGAKLAEYNGLQQARNSELNMRKMAGTSYANYLATQYRGGVAGARTALGVPEFGDFSNQVDAGDWALPGLEEGGEWEPAPLPGPATNPSLGGGGGYGSTWAQQQHNAALGGGPH